MSKNSTSSIIVNQAEEKEKKYFWLQAAESYKQALSMVLKKDFLEKVEILQKMAHCLYRAAFQAESQEEFVKNYFLEKVSPQLMTIVLNDLNKFPLLKDTEAYLAVKMVLNKTKKEGES